MSANKSVSAAFTLNAYTLNASKTGTGSGTLAATGLSASVYSFPTILPLDTATIREAARHTEPQ